MFGKDDLLTVRNVLAVLLAAVAVWAWLNSGNQSKLDGLDRKMESLTGVVTTGLDEIAADMRLAVDALEKEDDTRRQSVIDTRDSLRFEDAQQHREMEEFRIRDAYHRGMMDERTRWLERQKER